MNIVEKIKKNWKNILIILLCFLWFRGCVTQCNRNGEIRENVAEIAQLDSTITALKDTIDAKTIVIDQQNIMISEQSKTIERLDRAASKSITVKPPQVVIKQEDIKN